MVDGLSLSRVAANVAISVAGSELCGVAVLVLTAVVWGEL